MTARSCSREVVQVQNGGSGLRVSEVSTRFPDMPSTERPYLSVTEAARVFEVTPRTILNWIAAGHLAADKPVPGPTNPYTIPRESINRRRAELDAQRSA